jgi:biopolymer transport protein TolR
MAISFANGRGQGGRRKSAYKPLAEINVTPFVDVMLVLLIVFMVAAPLLTVGVPVDLPQAKAPNLSQQEEPLVVSLRADGTLYLQETVVTKEALVPRLQAITGANPEARIYVRGDKAIAYGEVMSVMGTIASAGFTKVALVTELPREQRRR